MNTHVREGPGTGGTSLLGNAVPRREDANLVRGRGGYAGNVILDGMLHAHFVRSTVAHGRILSIAVDEARAMPGVIAVYTAANLGLADRQPGMKIFPEAMARPFLARDRVRFVGEPLAVVLADDPYRAADAADAVWADVEPLRAVVDVDDALTAETLLFEDLDHNICWEQSSRTPIDFLDCEAVVGADLVNSRVAAVSIEARVATATYEDDRLTCWASSQGAHSHQESVATALDLDPDDVRVVVADIGGGFGAKGLASEEEIVVAQLARLNGRPVRWAETRTENLIGYVHGRAQKQTVTMGGTRDGRITHYRLHVVQDSGSYPKWGAYLPEFTRWMASGVYDIANVEFSSISVATNTAPICAYRGAGRPEATAAIERAVDLFAAEIGMDPAEVRRANLPGPSAFPFTNATGTVYDSGDYEAALDRALSAVDYPALRAEQSRRRAAGDRRQLGLGLGTYVEVTGFGGSEYGRVELKTDGTVRAVTGTTPIGTGHATTWAMLVADRLGVPIDDVEIVYGDTDLVPSGGTTGGSRSVQLAGSAMVDASDKLVDAARQLVADLLEAAVDDVVLDKEGGGFHVAGTPALSRTWAEVGATAEESGEGLSGLSDFSQEGATFPFGTHLVVVEVDTETGLVVVERIVAVDDAGILVNPLLAAGQIHGGLAQGVAQALFEEFLYDSEGNPQTSNLADYSAVSTMEVPSYERIVMETTTPVNPLGAKGIGEAGSIGSTAAVQNAVIDALNHLGISHLDMPLTPEKIWRALSDA